MSPVNRNQFHLTGFGFVRFNKVVKKMNDELILKNHLKKFRQQQGLSQQTLADLIGVSRNTISSIETGQFNPTAKLALLLCIPLEVTFEDIIYFEN